MESTEEVEKRKDDLKLFIKNNYYFNYIFLYMLFLYSPNQTHSGYYIVV